MRVVRVGGLACLALLSNHDLLFFDFTTNSMLISVMHLPPFHAVHHRPQVSGPSRSRLESMSTKKKGGTKWPLTVSQIWSDRNYAAFKYRDEIRVDERVSRLLFPFVSFVVCMSSSVFALHWWIMKKEDIPVEGTDRGVFKTVVLVYHGEVWRGTHPTCTCRFVRQPQEINSMLYQFSGTLWPRVCSMQHKNACYRYY